MPAEWVIWAGIALWAGGAFLFCTPWFVWVQILLVGGTVLSLLAQFDGTIRLLSKMCTYCLLLSIVWVLEPAWDPSRSRRRAAAAVLAQARGPAVMLVPMPVRRESARLPAYPVDGYECVCGEVTEQDE